MAITDLLIVGTFGGGGIHQYAEEQQRHLPDRLDVSTYDMYTPPAGEGVLWLLRSLLLTAWAALRFPFASRPEVVHVHTSHQFSFLRAGYYVLVAKWLWRRPVVLHVHGSSFDEFVDDPSPLVSRFQRTVFGASDAVIVLSAYWKRTLSDVVTDAPIHVLPNAVVPDEYDPSIGADPQHLVFLSNLIERKGVSEFVEAVDDMYDRAEEPVRTTVAGAGPLADEVEALADRHDAVEYRGYVSEAEGLPIAMLEAMAGGNAVVSTTVGSIPEVIDDERGRLVEPGDPDALADALVELVDAPAAVEEMGRRNHAAVREEYSWAAATETLVSLYEAVAGGVEADRSGRPRTGSADRVGGTEQVVERGGGPDVGQQ